MLPLKPPHDDNGLDIEGGPKDNCSSKVATTTTYCKRQSPRTPPHTHKEAEYTGTFTSRKVEKE